MSLHPINHLDGPGAFEHRSLSDNGVTYPSTEGLSFRSDHSFDHS